MTEPSSSAQLAASSMLPDPATAMGRELSLLTSHLLLHILEIDRSYGQQRARDTHTQPTRNPA
jgi:hypothetical protein